MINVGKFNRLKVTKIVEFGVYVSEEGNEQEKILLPKRYHATELKENDFVDVFVYLDSEDRLIAVTTKPLAQVGEIKLLECVDANKIGAFLNWGLDKDLFVPFKHQSYRMFKGQSYVVKVLYDEKSNRIIASNNFSRILKGAITDFAVDQEVKMIIFDETEIGFKVIIDKKFTGMIFKNQIFQNVKIGDEVKGFVSKIREDGKIDLVLTKSGFQNKLPEKDRVLEIIKNAPNGFIPITSKTPPNEILRVFNLSKKTFKQMIGMLYKERKILIKDDGIYLVK